MKRRSGYLAKRKIPSTSINSSARHKSASSITVGEHRPREPWTARSITWRVMIDADLTWIL
jgi:hypothetical protein